MLKKLFRKLFRIDTVERLTMRNKELATEVCRLRLRLKVSEEVITKLNHKG